MQCHEIFVFSTHVTTVTHLGPLFFFFVLPQVEVSLSAPRFYSIVYSTHWLCPGPLPQWSGALTMCRHIYSSSSWKIHFRGNICEISDSLQADTARNQKSKFAKFQKWLTLRNNALSHTLSRLTLRNNALSQTLSRLTLCNNALSQTPSRLTLRWSLPASVCLCRPLLALKENVKF